MEPLFLIGALLSLSIFGISSYSFVKLHNHNLLRKTSLQFFLAGSLYLVISIFFILWTFDKIKYNHNDFLFIYIAIIVLQNIFSFYIIYHYSHNSNLFYLLVFYLEVFFFVLFLGSYFMNLLLMLSFLISLMFFMGLLFKLGEFKGLGFFGSVYSFISLILTSLYFLNVGDILLYAVISEFFLLILFISFFKHIKSKPPELMEKKSSVAGYLLTFLRHFVFVIVIIGFVFISTIVVHEFGHLGASNLYGCQYGKIVYENGLPHTEILCGTISNTLPILGGILFPLAIALLLILVGGRFVKEIGLLILGFGLIISYQDFSDIFLSDNVIIFVMIIGVLLSLAGIILLSKSRTEDYVYSAKYD